MKLLTTMCVVALGMFGRAGAAELPFSLTSPDLPAGKPIAEQFMANIWGCHGGNESPELKWSHAPAGTRSFAVTWFDPYTPPDSGWWHWVVYDIPATATGLARKAGSPGSPDMPKEAKQGLPDGDAPERHYYGPCPDPGDPPHRYTVTVYALKVDRLVVAPTSSTANIETSILEQTLAKATIVHPFARPKKAE